MKHWGPVVARNGDLTAIDCEHCGWAHLVPLPDEKEVKAFYENDGQYTNDSWFEKELKEHRKGFWEAYYESQAKLLYTPHSTIIDWGCGAGFFLHWWRRGNKSLWALGVEPSKRAREFYPKIHPSPISCSAPIFSLGKNAPVFPQQNHRISLVLEHLVDPLGFMKMIGKRGESKVLIVVPNEITNPIQKKVGGNWWVQKHHINYFTPQGLRRLLWKAGFEVTYETATAPMEIFILLGLDYRENDKLGKQCHEFRLRFERRFGRTAFALYHLLYKRFGWGRELVFVAEKIN